MRPYWKTSCPIALHRSTAERIAFRQINKATGNRLRQQLIDEETREPLADRDLSPAVRDFVEWAG
jgi:DNA end-binding protein Ku